MINDSEILKAPPLLSHCSRHLDIPINPQFIYIFRLSLKCTTFILFRSISQIYALFIFENSLATIIYFIPLLYYIYTNFTIHKDPNSTYSTQESISTHNKQHNILVHCFLKPKPVKLGDTFRGRKGY